MPLDKRLCLIELHADGIMLLRCKLFLLLMYARFAMLNSIPGKSSYRVLGLIACTYSHYLAFYRICRH